jgi:hypothetical protein
LTKVEAARSAVQKQTWEDVADGDAITETVILNHPDTEAADKDGIWSE